MATARVVHEPLVWRRPTRIAKVRHSGSARRCPNPPSPAVPAKPPWPKRPNCALCDNQCDLGLFQRATNPPADPDTPMAPALALA